MQDKPLNNMENNTIKAFERETPQRANPIKYRIFTISHHSGRIQKHDCNTYHSTHEAHTAAIELAQRTTYRTFDITFLPIIEISE